MSERVVKATGGPDPARRGYRSPKREQAALETRRRIRSTAERLFLRDGYIPTTTRAISREAGVAEMTLFNAFPSKAALLSEIVRVNLRGDDRRSSTPQPMKSSGASPNSTATSSPEPPAYSRSPKPRQTATPNWPFEETTHMVRSDPTSDKSQTHSTRTAPSRTRSHLNTLLTPSMSSQTKSSTCDSSMNAVGAPPDTSTGSPTSSRRASPAPNTNSPRTAFPWRPP